MDTTDTERSMCAKYTITISGIECHRSVNHVFELKTIPKALPIINYMNVENNTLSASVSLYLEHRVIEQVVNEDRLKATVFEEILEYIQETLKQKATLYNKAVQTVRDIIFTT